MNGSRALNRSTVDYYVTELMSSTPNGPLVTSKLIANKISSQDTPQALLAFEVIQFQIPNQWINSKSSSYLNKLKYTYNLPNASLTNSSSLSFCWTHLSLQHLTHCRCSLNSVPRSVDIDSLMSSYAYCHPNIMGTLLQFQLRNELLSFF